jgi:hypothetical protein
MTLLNGASNRSDRLLVRMMSPAGIPNPAAIGVVSDQIRRTISIGGLGA